MKKRNREEKVVNGGSVVVVVVVDVVVVVGVTSTTYLPFLFSVLLSLSRPLARLLMFFPSLSLPWPCVFDDTSIDSVRATLLFCIGCFFCCCCCCCYRVLFSSSVLLYMAAYRDDPDRRGYWRARTWPRISAEKQMRATTSKTR